MVGWSTGVTGGNRGTERHLWEPCWHDTDRREWRAGALGGLVVTGERRGTYGSHVGMILTGENGGLEHWGYDCNRGTERHSERNLSLCHFVRHKSHKDRLII